MKAQLVAIGFSSIGGQPQFFLLAFILNHQTFILHPSAFILNNPPANADGTDI